MFFFCLNFSASPCSVSLFSVRVFSIPCCTVCIAQFTFCNFTFLNLLALGLLVSQISTKIWFCGSFWGRFRISPLRPTKIPLLGPVWDFVGEKRIDFGGDSVKKVFHVRPGGIFWVRGGEIWNRRPQNPFAKDFDGKKSSPDKIPNFEEKWENYLDRQRYSVSVSESEMGFSEFHVSVVPIAPSKLFHFKASLFHFTQAVVLKSVF